MLEWEQKKSQLVFNFQDQTLNPARLRSTSYKFNKQTTHPQADSVENEMKHEVRKQELLKVFNDTLKPHGLKKKPSLASRSNLSPIEVKGFKSLRKRISAKVLVVCETDKSSKLAVLSRDQYLASGLVQCSKDLEVNLSEVTRLQNFVNANVDWMHQIFGTGEFWGHQDRIRNSSSDEGSQVAPLRLLIKDHKNWDIASGKPPPSRPVCNGKSGYNCYLSELPSIILGPVAQEASGSEINSCGDLLASINSVKDSLSHDKVGVNQVDPAAFEPCDHCNNCSKPEPSKFEIDRAKEVNQRVDSKKINSALNITHNLKNKLKVSRAPTVLYHGACRSNKGVAHSHKVPDMHSHQEISSQGLTGPHENDSVQDKVSLSLEKVLKLDSSLYESDFNLGNGPNINHNSGMIISGYDVEQLYTSLRDTDTACIIRESVIHSEISFENFDANMALAYLMIVAGREALVQAGLKHLIPTWKGDRLAALKITGTTGRDMSKWIFLSYNNKFDDRRILAMVLEVGVLICMGSHIYEFGNKFYLQTRGGPIGLSLTAWVASIVMKAFNNLWCNLAQKMG